MWREALKDQNNDLYEAAWLLFTPGISIETASDRLGDNKEAIIELLQTVLDEDELYDEDAYGDGNAPVKAIYLLGEWKVIEALPTLLEVLEVSEANDQVREAVITSLRNMGDDIIDGVIEWGTENPEFSLEATDILGSAAAGNEAAFTYIREWVEKEDEDIEYYAEQLILIDPDAAQTFFEDFNTNDNENRKLFRTLAREAKKVSKERAEARLAARKAEPEDEPAENTEEE